MLERDLLLSRGPTLSLALSYNCPYTVGTEGGKCRHSRKAARTLSVLLTKIGRIGEAGGGRWEEGTPPVGLADRLKPGFSGRN